MGIISLSIQDMFNLLEKKTKDYLLGEIMNYKILNEFDLQCRFVTFLKEYIETFRDKRWHIFNTYYLKAAKKIPDILIFLDYKPVIFIEIKYFGFNNPKKDKILRDIEKLHDYFNIYSLTIRRGYSLNVFTYTEENFKKFNQLLNNNISLNDIKFININLRDIENFDQIKSIVLDRITRMASNLKERIL